MKEILVSAVQTAVISLLLFYWQRKQDKTDKAAAQLAQEKKQEQMLTLELIMASAALSYANACAIERGITNGEMKMAKQAYLAAQDKYKEYERKQAAQRMSA